MIRLTGDIHGEIFERFNPAAMPGEDGWTEDDKLIVLGDFGLIFYPRTAGYADTAVKLEELRLEYLESKPYEILFIDGNHENFDRLFTEFSETERYGEKVRRIGRNVFWLQRGSIYTIDGKTFFCMGGAYSVDKAFRQEHVSWWIRESPDEEEYRTASESLKAHGNRTDYILTHTCPGEFIPMMGHIADPCDYELTSFFNMLWYNTGFRHWYFGHWHTDRQLHPKATAVYREVITLPAADAP